MWLYLSEGLHPTSLSKMAAMALCSTAAWRPWRGSENDQKIPRSNVQCFKKSSDTAADSVVPFVSLTVHSFRRSFLENLSHCQNSLAKSALIRDVDSVSKRRRWG
jgi:hypothetical protein